MKKNILFVMPSLSSGGAEKSLVTLLNLIDYNKYNVDLYLFRKAGLFVDQIPEKVNLMTAGHDYELFDGSFKKAILSFLKLGKFSLAFHRIKYAWVLFSHKKNKQKLAWQCLSQAMTVPEKEYDVAIGYLEGTSVYFCVDKAKAKKRIGYIHTDYNRIIEQKKTDEPYFKKLDVIVGVSKSCVDILNKFFPFTVGKTRVVENIISKKAINKMAQTNKSVYDNKGGETVILTIGRLSKPKGIDNAVNACAILKENGYKIKWYQIGVGELKAEIESQIKSKGLENEFVMLGEKSNPYPYIKQCDVYVQPSNYEGKAIAVDEVKCVQKPIVVTDFSTVFDQIENGKNGLIANKNPQSIADKIKHLIDNPEKKAEFCENLKRESVGNEEEINKLYEIIDIV